MREKMNKMADEILKISKNDSRDETNEDRIAAEYNYIHGIYWDFASTYAEELEAKVIDALDKFLKPLLSQYIDSLGIDEKLEQEIYTNIGFIISERLVDEFRARLYQFD